MNAQQIDWKSIIIGVICYDEPVIMTLQQCIINLCCYVWYIYSVTASACQLCYCYYYQFEIPCLFLTDIGAAFNPDTSCSFFVKVQ